MGSKPTHTPWAVYPCESAWCNTHHRAHSLHWGDTMWLCAKCHPDHSRGISLERWLESNPVSAKPSDITAISPMYLQRKLGISWAAARRAMDDMLDIGILWPIDQYGRNPINRDVLAKAVILIYKKMAENKESTR